VDATDIGVKLENPCTAALSEKCCCGYAVTKDFMFPNSTCIYPNRDLMEILHVLFKSGLPTEEVLRKFEERADKYRGVRGLLQKYYVQDKSSGEFGGVYVFDSKENLESFKDSDLAKSISDTYKYLEPPTRMVFNVNLILYRDRK
jgi:hypothetical protein